MTQADAIFIGYAIHRVEDKGYYLTYDGNLGGLVYRGNNGWGDSTEELIPYSTELDAWAAVVK